MKIVAQLGRTFIPYLKPILNSSKLKIEMKDAMVNVFKCSTVAENIETQIEMRGWTVEHFPGGDPQRGPLVDGVGGRLLCRHARHEGGHVGRAHQEKSWGGNSIENKFQLEFQLEKSLRVLA